MSIAFRKTSRLLALATIVLLTTGWTKKDVINSQEKPSAAIRAILVEVSKSQFVDPYSVRDAAVSSLVTVNPKKGLKAICVSANAKNRMGAYAGKIAFSVRIQNGQAVSVNTQAQGCQLQGLRYYPFPELEALE